MFIIKKLQDACAKPEEVVHVTNNIKTMSNDSTVRFVESNGKWVWKKYDAQGSVISRSPLFDSERACKEDYELAGGQSASAETAPENKPEETPAPVAPVEPEVGTAQSTENTAGTASAETAPEAPVEGSVNL